MKGNIFKYILVVSVLLNISLLGTAGYTYYKQSYGVSPGGPAGTATQSTQQCDIDAKHFFYQLSLKPEQVKLFQEKAAMFHQTVNVKRREVDRLRGSLVALMRTDEPDNRDIEGTISRINSLQQEMQKMVVAHMLEFKSMLDKDQQKKFLDLIQGAMVQRSETVCP